MSTNLRETPSVDWEPLLRGFAPAAPGLLARREMQRRTESKFVMPVPFAAALLPELQDHYALLLAGGRRVATYRSLYFDTADLQIFHAHRRGRRVRHKVRIRHYPERHLSFLEVKTRRGGEVSIKERAPRTYDDSVLHAEDAAFVRAHTHVRQDLLPQAWTDFRRITLLGTATEERVTLDFDLWVTTAGHARSLGGLAVVEVKQSRRDRHTTVMQALRRAGWREGWASKYCAAIALTRPEVRASRLSGELRTLTAVAAWAS